MLGICAVLVMLSRLFLPSACRADEAVYGFKDIDIEYLADKLAATFGIHFYTYHNPVLGFWCSSVPASTKDGLITETTGAKAKQPTYIIMRNTIGPRIPGAGAGDYLLMVTAVAHEIDKIREKLGSSGLKFKEIKRKR